MKGPIENQPVLRHTGGIDGQPAGFPALLYDDVRGHFPQSCIPLARNNRTMDVSQVPGLANFHTPARLIKKSGQSRNYTPP